MALEKSILDACCGSRMFWFDKENADTVYMDCRELDTELCDGRRLVVYSDASNLSTNRIRQKGHLGFIS